MKTDNAGIFFLTWFIILGFLALMNRWEGTRVIVYYILILAIVLDIVTHYEYITKFAVESGLITADQIGPTPSTLGPGVPIIPV